MFDSITLNTLLSKNESPILEFKSQWYWNKNDNSDKAKGWGEFLKDFASLVNANHNYYGQKRYLIFGVNDDGNVCGINFEDLDSPKFINDLKNKVENFFNFYPEFYIHSDEIEGKKVKIFEIIQPDQILKVIKEFHDQKIFVEKILFL